MNDTIRLKDLKDYFCKIRCPFYTDDFSCSDGQSCFLQDIKTKIFDSYNGTDISYQLVDYKFNPINPEIDKFDRHDIIGVVLDRRVPGTNYWICMVLTELIEDIWCTDPSLEIKTTLEDPVENHKIMEKVSKNLVKFPSAKLIEDFSRGVGRRYYLGSSVDYLEIQRNIKKIKTIIKKYNLKSNIDFGNYFWTSSTGYDKYICGLDLDGKYVNCCYDRDLSYSVLPIGILIL